LSGTIHALRPPHAAPIISHPKQAKGNDLSRRLPKAWAKLSQPNSRSSSKSAWKTTSKRSSRRSSRKISMRPPHRFDLSQTEALAHPRRQVQPGH
jgi:hypothetical protein